MGFSFCFLSFSESVVEVCFLGCALCFRSGTPFVCVCRAGLSCARVHVVVLGFDD